jgi:hypothetical protein
MLDGRRLTKVESMNAQNQEIKDRRVTLVLFRGGREMSVELAPRLELTPRLAPELIGALVGDLDGLTLNRDAIVSDLILNSSNFEIEIHGNLQSNVAPGQHEGNAAVEIARLKRQLTAMRKSLAALEKSLAPAEEKTDETPAEEGPKESDK